MQSVTVAVSTRLGTGSGTGTHTVGTWGGGGVWEELLDLRHAALEVGVEGVARFADGRTRVGVVGIHVVPRRTLY